MKRNSLPDHHDDLAALLAELTALQQTVQHVEKQTMKRWTKKIADPHFLSSASNLAAYIGLRQNDVRGLQERLSRWGLSSLGRSESHILGSIDTIVHTVGLMLGDKTGPAGNSGPAWHEGSANLAHRAEKLLGSAPVGRSTRFMVTLPTEAASHPTLIRDLMIAGMNCARINCAHDSLETWLAMVRQIRLAAQETGLNCKILTDLAGPKLRTGSLANTTPVLHIRPKRNAAGKLMEPASIVLQDSALPDVAESVGQEKPTNPVHLKVESAWLQQVEPGDHVIIHDVRGHKCQLLVRSRMSGGGLLADCYENCHIGPDTTVERRDRHGKCSRTSIEDLPAFPVTIRLRRDDELLLTRELTPGAPAQIDGTGRQTRPARIACSHPEIFTQIHPGERIWIDDGHIGGQIISIDDEGALIRITHARPQGNKLKAAKGLNFPDSSLNLPFLTEADRNDLAFAVKHADIVGCSFVRTASDLDQLLDVLAEHKAGHIGIVAKIETREAVRNLPEIIVSGAGHHPFGVMIARGDLAVEIGYESLAQVQEEILWICEAAGVPVIWATQVLESLVKQDIPSRAELTDAAMGGRAECIMLNKGPFLLDALKTLDIIVSQMQRNQIKKTPQLCPIGWPELAN